MNNPTKLFNFAANDYAPKFAANGFVVIKNGLSNEFLNCVDQRIDACMGAGDISRSKRRLKQEFLFDFPSDDGLIIELVETIGELTGLPPEDLIISERHLKVYRQDAPQNPPPHKDRRGTQVAIGFCIDVAAESRLILYPYNNVSENKFDSYDQFLASLSEKERPENALRGIDPLIVDTRRGDFIAFHGSTIWHERTNAAGSKLLYLKMNALGLDPLGENLPMLPLKTRRWPQRAESPSIGLTAGT
jgi:hypothetical protein